MTLRMRLGKHWATHLTPFLDQRSQLERGNYIVSYAFRITLSRKYSTQKQGTDSFVTVGSLGYPYHVDMHLYTYSFNSDTLTKVTKNVLAASLLISSIDLTDLTESDLGDIVQVCYDGSSEETKEKTLAALKMIRNEQIAEKKGESKSGSGSSTAAFRVVSQDLGTSERLLDFGVIEKDSHDAWKAGMKAEEAIPSYQPPKVSNSLRWLLDKLD